MAINPAAIASNAANFAAQIGWAWTYTPGTGRVMFEGPIGSCGPGASLSLVFLIDEQAESGAAVLARWNTVKANLLAGLAAA